MKLMRASTSSHVWSYICDSSTAYDAYNQVANLFKNSETQDMMQLNWDWERLTFKPGYNSLLYLTRFEQIINNYKIQGCSFSEECKRTNFLSKIRDIENINSPMYTFYCNANGLLREQQNLETTIQMFLEVDTLKYSKRRKLNSSNTSIELINNNLYSNFSSDSNESLKCINVNHSSLMNTDHTLKRKNALSSHVKQDKRQKTDSRLNYSNSLSKTRDNLRTRRDSRRDRLDQDKPFCDNTYASKNCGNTTPDKSTRPKRALDKYTKDQMKLIKRMLAAEKEEKRCKKCLEYFHNPYKCPNPALLCYECHEYNHIAQNCPNKNKDKKQNEKY